MTIALVALASWFGFEIGRRWEAGQEEEAAEAVAATHARGRIRLSTIRVRR